VTFITGIEVVNNNQPRYSINVLKNKTNFSTLCSQRNNKPYMRSIVFFALLVVLPCSVIVNAQWPSEKRTKICLNGWWDFLPVLDGTGRQFKEPGEIPEEGWLVNAMIVPGSWVTSSTEGENADTPWTEWRISDSYSFPSEWNQTNTAWYRRYLTLNSIDKTRKYFLQFDGILRESWIFINGHIAGHRKEGTLFSEHDITPYLIPGNNEIVVYITDYRRDENNRTYVHVGSDQMDNQRGIWGDVNLDERPAVRIQDLTIRTSTRNNEITLIYKLINETKKSISLRTDFSISENDRIHKSFGGQKITLRPGESETYECIEPWTGYIPWSPNNPQLYQLNIQLSANGNTLDYYTERFGFREVWIEGHNIILNGNIIHLRGEWGHKFHFGFFRPEYVRQWFGMLKELNMNYIRTHAFPHPKFMIDLADENGILVSLESAWFFSYQATDNDEFWNNAKEYARDIVNRYKNHPSIIFWSVGNEVRWGWDISEVIARGPEVQKVYEDLDTTRVAFSDGSTSLWDERTQKIISRHYGLECSGEDGWDRSKPLNVGELGKWHYGQPIDNLVWGNDEIFASFEKCVTAIAQETSDIILQARSNEVSCLFPWNLSCLDNYRSSTVEIKHNWTDFNTPYAKPLRTAPYGAEFTWWEPDSKGYIPGPGFDIIRHANRPFAVYIREKLNQVFDDEKIKHTVSLINDLGKTTDGTLRIEVTQNNETVYSKETIIQVTNGGTSKMEYNIPVKKVNSKSKVIINTYFLEGQTVTDSISRVVWATPSEEKVKPVQINECFVFGSGVMDAFLNKHKIKYHRIGNLEEILIHPKAVLIIEKNSITAGSTQNKTLAAFINNGGRVFIMEQDNSALPDISIQPKPSERCFIRAYNHPLMNQFTADEFAYWGDDPYGKSNSASYVVSEPFLKPDKGNTSILLDCGYGDFGNGGLNWSPLFETRAGKGIAMISQLRLSDKFEVHPSANKLILQILKYLSDWTPDENKELAVIDSNDIQVINKLGFKSADKDIAHVLVVSGQALNDETAVDYLNKRLHDGSNIIIHELDSAAIRHLGEKWRLDIAPVNLGKQYNLIRGADNKLLNGISNQETYWLDAGTYCQATENRKITDWLISSDSGTTLLTSENESCWREFYTQGASSEKLRMAVITHYLFNGPRESASGMIAFPINKGMLILTQMPLPEDDYYKAEIFWSQLLTNLNVTSSLNLFDGEKVAYGSQKSNGFPDSIRIINNPDSEMLNKIIGQGDPGEISERFRNQGLTDGFSWDIIKTPEGVLNIPDNCRDAVIYFELNPGRSRRLITTTGNWPDPSQQTLVDFAGEGTITLYVNGKKFQPLELDGKKNTISDINLNQYWNSILIHFIPRGRDLKILWRNRQGEPELEFEFN
jgi:beta-galactosidase